MTDTIGNVGIMRFLTKLPFRTQINLGITAVVLVFAILSALFVSRIATNAMLGEIKRRGLSLGLSLAGRIADPMLALDFLRLRNMVDEVIESSDDIVYAFVQERNGQILSHTFKAGFPIQWKADRAHDFLVRTLISGRLKNNLYAPGARLDGRVGNRFLPGFACRRIDQRRLSGPEGTP